MSALASHAGQLTINRAALAANWRLLNARCSSGVAGAVIKADAYGLGIGIAAPALFDAGCRTFFVAHVSEAIRARAVLPEGEIFVLNGLAAGEVHLYAAHRLSPVLGSLDELELWEGFCQANPVATPGAMHVDTGMNRLGLRPETFRELLTAGRFPNAAISLVMSHFVSSEVAASPVTARQHSLFQDLAGLLRAADHVRASRLKTRLSLCNSSGHFLGAVVDYDLSRPGYALYGGNPTPGLANPMRQVVRLEAPVVQILSVPKGETVGYGSNFKATRDSLIATVSCGYADGYPRNAGASPHRKGGSAVLAGQECPFAGNVSMDLITIDITHLERQSVKVGDMALLLGDGLDLDRVGEAAGTIGYEILTNLGSRYQRELAGA
ncbi:Alr Alanine racemase [Rhabdaerophilaceae bacterium]